MDKVILAVVIFMGLLNLAGTVILAMLYSMAEKKMSGKETVREIIREVKVEVPMVRTGGTVPDSVVKTYIPRADYDENYDGLIQSGKTKE